MGFGFSVESAISEGALRAILIKQQWVDAELNRRPSNEGFKRCPFFQIASLFPSLGLAKGKRAYTKPLMYNQNKTCKTRGLLQWVTIIYPNMHPTRMCGCKRHLEIQAFLGKVPVKGPTISKRLRATSHISPECTVTFLYCTAPKKGTLQFRILNINRTVMRCRKSHGGS